MTLRRALWPLAVLTLTGGLTYLGWQALELAREIIWPSQARPYDFEAMDKLLREAGFVQPQTQGFVLIYRDNPTYVFWARFSGEPTQTGSPEPECETLRADGRCEVLGQKLVAWRPDGASIRFLVSRYPTYASQSELFLRAYRDPEAVPMPLAERP